MLLFNQLAALIAGPLTSPEVRAAAVRALGSVRGAELVQTDEDRVVVAFEFTDFGRVPRTLELDLSSAHLAADTTKLLEGLDMFGITVGTIISQRPIPASNDYHRSPSGELSRLLWLRSTPAEGAFNRYRQRYEVST